MSADEVRARVRSGALLFAVQGALGLLASVLPHPPGYDDVLLQAPGAFGVLVGVLLWRVGWRVAGAGWTALLVVAMAMVGLATVGSDGVATQALGFLPGLIWAGWFLRPAQVIGLTAWVALVYAGMLAVGDLPAGLDPPGQWVFTVAYLGLGAAVATSTRTRMGRLADAAEHAARTDALTGLGNRRRLQADLDALVERRSRPGLLVLYDLNGFKLYNDRFGHPAGDALLARLGGRLQEAAGAGARAYRLGGDEFCVLAAGPNDPEALQAAGAAALRESGDGFEIQAMHGAAWLPAEASTPAAALGLADTRMYRRKHARPTSAASQAAQALLGALRERDRDLARHNDDVADLVVAVGRRLGIDHAALHDLVQAAALHDVGKIALPEPLLDKPGPLDEEEWRFMRQHTVIGERILLAAPALAGVARLVRASHERVDGGGYPDGLAGEAIPLGARVLAVCDAFDAMTSDRPYRPAQPVAVALAELRRCAGRQFDVTCVAALEAEVARRAAAPIAA